MLAPGETGKKIEPPKGRKFSLAWESAGVRG
jgi:hypothetical protein